MLQIKNEQKGELDLAKSFFLFETKNNCEEQVVLNYRTAVLCFAVLDFFTTLLNIIAGLVSTRTAGKRWLNAHVFVGGIPSR